MKGVQCYEHHALSVNCTLLNLHCVVCSYFRSVNMAANVVGEGIRYVRPILSTNHADAKRRVLNLYRAWHRQIPYVGMILCFCSLP